MTEQERADVQELIDSFPRCYTYGGEGPDWWGAKCQEVAVMSHPTAVIGDWSLRCAKHPGATENEFGDTAQPTRWAAIVARWVARGFRSSLGQDSTPATPWPGSSPNKRNVGRCPAIGHSPERFRCGLSEGHDGNHTPLSPAGFKADGESSE